VARNLQITDEPVAMLVEDAGPGGIRATIVIVPMNGGDPADGDRVRLSRGDVRTLIAFLESLSD
jgi:hypothetical protein